MWSNWKVASREHEKRISGRRYLKTAYMVTVAIYFYCLRVYFFVKVSGLRVGSNFLASLVARMRLLHKDFNLSFELRGNFEKEIVNHYGIWTRSAIFASVYDNLCGYFSFRRGSFDVLAIPCGLPTLQGALEVGVSFRLIYLALRYSLFARRRITNFNMFLN